MPKGEIPDTKTIILLREKTTIRVSQYTVEEINKIREQMKEEYGLKLTHDDVVRGLLSLVGKIEFINLDVKSRLKLLEYHLKSKGCFDKTTEFTINALIDEVDKASDLHEIFSISRHLRIIAGDLDRATKTTTVSEKNERDKSPDGEIDGSEGGSR